MITKKNFSGLQGPPGIPLDDTYEFCNFSQPQSIDVGGNQRGVRLFPGDDTPRTFINCNLMNAEPPPGSTVTSCMTTMVKTNVVASTEEITIDDATFEIEHHSNYVYGRLDADALPGAISYIDLGVPEEHVID